MRELNIHIKNLIRLLKDEGVSFYFDPEISRGKRLENVCFEKDGTVYKLYEGFFFRDFGQSVYFKKVKNDIVSADYTDSIFYEEQQIKISNYFNGNNQKSI